MFQFLPGCEKFGRRGLPGGQDGGTQIQVIPTKVRNQMGYPEYQVIDGNAIPLLTKVVNFETLPYHRLTGKTIGKNAFTSKKLGKTFFAQKQQNIESFEMNMAL